MIKIMNDADAITLIERLYRGSGKTEEENDQIIGLLEEYQSGIASVLIHSSPLPSPEEALRIARERNKPIIL
jgi:hypothetical protein